MPTTLFAAALGLSLDGDGHTRRRRSAPGGPIGAGIAGGPVFRGALLGGAVGTGTGAPAALERR
jgi:hypothetical protein